MNTVGTRSSQAATKKGTADVKSLTKGDWTLNAASDLGPGIKTVVFAGVLGTRECGELYVSELGK